MGGELNRIRNSLIEDYKEKLNVSNITIKKGIYSFSFEHEENISFMRYNKFNHSLTLYLSKDTDFFLSSCIKNTIIINLGLEPDYITNDDNMVWFDPFNFNSLKNENNVSNLTLFKKKTKH